jgi:hypothetical protein
VKFAKKLTLMVLLGALISSCNTSSPGRREANLTPNKTGKALSLTGGICEKMDVKVVVRAIWSSTSEWCACEKTETEATSCDGSCSGVTTTDAKPVGKNTGRLASAATPGEVEAVVDDDCPRKKPAVSLAHCEAHCAATCGQSACQLGTEVIGCHGIDGSNETCSWTCPSNKACGEECYACTKQAPTPIEE